MSAGPLITRPVVTAKAKERSDALMPEERPSPYSAAGRDAADLRIAESELDAATEMLSAAHRIVDRIERREAIRSAVGRLGLAVRAIRVVEERYERR